MDEEQRKGQVKVLYGDGRGKTSTAMGEALKAVSCGQKVNVVFFMKGERKGAEYKSLDDLGVEYAVFGRRGFLSGADAQTKDRELARQALDYAEDQIISGKWDLVVLDEINNAEDYGLVTLEDILKLLSARPANLSILLTGKAVDRRISAAADQVCVFHNIKHPYDKGILARRGFDY